MGSDDEERNVVVFEDYFPAMVEKLGAEGFMKELSNGFRLLADEEKGLITLESLKKNAKNVLIIGLELEEAKCMLREGDLNGDGALDLFEFSTLMFRLSPSLMNSATQLFMPSSSSSFFSF